MIERLLAGDAALERGDLELASRLFTQVADADGRNAIAVVGLARISIARGDRDAARASLEHALQIDPDEAAAQRLLAELADEPTPEELVAPLPASPEPSVAPPGHGLPERPAAAPTAEPAPPVPEPAAPSARPSLLERLRRWLRMSPRQR